MNQFDAMILSMAIEGPVALGLMSWRGWQGRGPTHAALAIMLATAATHPQLWAVALWLYPRLGYVPTVLLAETVVVLAEAGIVGWATGLSPAKSLLLSALANAGSTLVGLMLVA